jgi:hypothetical protein
VTGHAHEKEEDGSVGRAGHLRPQTLTSPFFCTEFEQASVGFMLDQGRFLSSQAEELLQIRVEECSTVRPGVLHFRF